MIDEINPFRWNRHHDAGDFAYAGRDDPRWEIEELLRRGLRGRVVADDRPPTALERERLAHDHERWQLRYESSIHCVEALSAPRQTERNRRILRKQLGPRLGPWPSESRST